MQGRSAHFSSSSSPFWGALLFQRDPELSKARIFLQSFPVTAPLIFSRYLSPPTKGKQDFYFFSLPSVDPCQTTASWRSHAARPGAERGCVGCRNHKRFFRFPGFPAVSLNHTTYPAVLPCFRVLWCTFCTVSSLFISANTYRILMRVQWAACTWRGVCCSHNEACREPGATEARSQRMLLSPL